MPLRLQTCGALAGLTLVLGLHSASARAALGEPEAAVQTEAVTSQAQVKMTDRSGYRIHEMQLPSGTLLREFSASGGNVFAVTWNGPSLPNLRQALGHYFDDYVNASKAGIANHTAGHTHLELRQDDLVIQSRGHMRAFSGRAYLPHSLPVGVAVDDLQ